MAPPTSAVLTGSATRETVNTSSAQPARIATSRSFTAMAPSGSQVWSTRAVRRVAAGVYVTGRAPAITPEVVGGANFYWLAPSLRSRGAVEDRSARDAAIDSWCLGTAVLQVGLGAARHEQLDDRVEALRGTVQRRVAIVVARVHVCAERQHELDRRQRLGPVGQSPRRTAGRKKAGPPVRKAADSVFHSTPAASINAVVPFGITTAPSAPCASRVRMIPARRSGQPAETASTRRTCRATRTAARRTAAAACLW